ncbi:MAG: hypothetical protein PHF92_04870 [Bacteroidales bacterium]|nr:hypothetical protein [Bacteroidales bacterium]
MKTLLSLFFSLAFVVSLSAQGLIVVQNDTSTRTFYTIPEAVTAAVDGDYVYIPGGTFQVSGLIINKTLNIIGAGHVPEATTATGRTVINGGISFTGGSDFSLLQGIFHTGDIWIGEGTASDNITVSNILISRCNLERIQLNAGGWSPSNTSAQNIVFRDCIFRSNVNCTYNNRGHLFSNCIFQDMIQYIEGGVTINNSIFLRTAATPLYSFSSGLLNNCIIVCEANPIHGSAKSTFNNCILGMSAFPTNESSSDYHYFNNCLAYGSNVIGLFANVPEARFDYMFDFHLAEGSVASGFGLEGTDCGIYGGAEPYKEGAIPINPHIQSIYIPGTTDGQGKLNISVTVEAQDN